MFSILRGPIEDLPHFFYRAIKSKYRAVNRNYRAINDTLVRSHVISCHARCFRGLQWLPVEEECLEVNISFFS